MIGLFQLPEKAVTMKLDKAKKAAKNNDAKVILIAFQLPRISIAKTKNPYPNTPEAKFHSPNLKQEKMINPPIEAEALPMAVDIYLILLTLIPTESAAAGFSPHALSLNPNLVLLIKNIKTNIKIIPIRTVMLILEKAPLKKADSVL